MPSVLRELRRHVQRFEPCLPRPAKQPPTGKGWIHEIKHDGFRIMAWRDGDDVRLLSRKGYDLTPRFKYAAAAMAALPVRSCLIDAEAIACNESGLADFELIRSYRHDHAVTLCAFDLLEIDGMNLRREPIEKRKDRLSKLLGGSHPDIALNEHFTDDGAIIYKHACVLGCEGIVSKRLGSPYRSGRSYDWIKVKNPAAPALAAMFLSTSIAFAADRMTSSDIQATFFNGKSFTASTTSGTQFKMAFTPD
jgi:bifunctional non-homologous end joining protein LigD